MFRGNWPFGDPAGAAYRMGLASYRRALESALLRGLRGGTRRHFSNRRKRPTESGAAAANVSEIRRAAVKSWISYHGAFLNVSPGMDWIRVRYSSLSVEPVRSSARTVARQAIMHAVRESVAAAWPGACGYRGPPMAYTGTRYRRTAKSSLMPGSPRFTRPNRLRQPPRRQLHRLVEASVAAAGGLRFYQQLIG